ncbi:hypothetical protein [Brevibacillus choshinensis]|uniref:hypothetical protein n=1 Tax=Brevibacillus choshinensis TaxID=54911 RepID=UPI002E22B834|nr:hypothetical protein [Brevibacillus choshinensis]
MPISLSRILFSMGRDRKLPQAVAKVHPNYQNPYVSAILIVIVSLIGCLGFQNVRPVLTNLVNFGAMTGLLTVNNYIMIRQKSKQIFAHMILPLIGL